MAPKKLFSTLLLVFISGASLAQVAGVTPLTITSLTSGNDVGRWTDTFDGEEPIGENYVYADLTVQNVWQIGDIYTPLSGVKIIHTKDADKNTTGASTISFTTNKRAQVCVWHLDAITTKPSWLATEGYTDFGHDITLPGGTASGYCAIKAAGALTLGGNTSDGSSACQHPTAR
jgi:hypothetical protein